MNRITNVSELDAAVKQAEEMLHADSHRILVCAGTGCLAGGSQKIYDRFCGMAEAVGGREGRICPGGGGCSYKRILSCRREEKRLSWILRDGARLCASSHTIIFT